MIGHWWVDPEELDDFQRKAIALPFDSNHLVTGPPGSGKTNLLVLRATNLIRSGVPNIRLLVFNRTLEEFIANNPTPYSLPRESLSTILRWEMKLIHQLGGKPVTDGEFNEVRRQNCNLLTKLVDEQKLRHLHDVILLDEAQDCIEEEINLIFRLGRHVFAAGDDRQRIYDHPDPIPLLEKQCNRHHLPHHYRNGERICALADEIGKAWDDYTPLHENAQYKEDEFPSKVTVTKCADIDEQAAKIVTSVRLQAKAYPSELIGVMCPRQKELAAVHKAFDGVDFEVVYQNDEGGYLPFKGTTRVCICTMHGAKGLEFRAAHIAGAEWVYRFRERQRRMIYTGVSRAKTILNLYHSGNLPLYLQSAVSAISPRPTPPTIKDLFKVS